MKVGSFRMSSYLWQIKGLPRTLAALAHIYSLLFTDCFPDTFCGSLQELWTKDSHKFRRSCLKVLGIVYTIQGTFSIWYSFRMLHCTPLLCSAKFSIKCYWFFQSDVIRKWLLPFGIVFCFCVLFGLTCSRFWAKVRSRKASAIKTNRNSFSLAAAHRRAICIN